MRFRVPDWTYAYANAPFPLALLSGVLLVIAYRLPHAWPLSFVALVPLLYAILRARSPARAARAGFCAGLFLIGAAVWWLFSTLPFPASFGAPGAFMSFALVFLSWLLTCLFMALPFALWAHVVRRLQLSRGIDVLVAATAFVACEWLTMLTYAVLAFSPTAHNPLFFSAGFLGYPLMDSSSWRQLAAFGGVYAATFAVALVNLLFFCILRYAAPERRHLLAGALALILLICTLAPIASLHAHLAPAATKPLTVAVASIQYPQQDIWQASSTIAAQETAFVQGASAQGADVILLPEGAAFLSPFSSRVPAEILPEGSRSVVVDSGALRVDNGSTRLRAVATAVSNQQPIRDKHILAPDGEYLPTYVSLILAAIGKPHAADTFTALRGFANGDGTGAALSVRDARMSVIFCAELFAPGLVSSLVEEHRLNLMLSAVSHAPFHDSFALEQDSLRFMRAQSVQAGVPMAVSALESPAYVIDRYGRILVGANMDFMQTAPEDRGLEWRMYTLRLP